jgi:cobalamin biosynthesis protein CobD/CbiB
MLPETFDPDTLRTAGVVALVVLVLVAFFVMRFIQKMVLRVIMLGVLVGLGVFVWFERDNLEECVPNCACDIAGFEVQVPDCPMPTG